MLLLEFCRCSLSLSLKLWLASLALIARAVSYFETVPDGGVDPELLKLGTDKSLFLDEGFLPFAQNFKGSQEAFFESYKKVRGTGCWESWTLLV